MTSPDTAAIVRIANHSARYSHTHSFALKIRVHTRLFALVFVSRENASYSLPPVLLAAKSA